MTNKQKEIKNNEAQTHMTQYEEEIVLLEYTVFMRNMYIDLYKQAVKEYEKNPERDENKCHIYHENYFAYVILKLLDHLSIHSQS